MTNLGSGGEAKASPADTIDTDPIDGGGDADQTGRGATTDAAMGANADPTLPEDPRAPQVGDGEAAAYGETIENAPAPGAG